MATQIFFGNQCDRPYPWPHLLHVYLFVGDRRNTNSLHERIRPLIIDVKEWENFGVVLIRTGTGKTKEAIESLEQVYKEVNPDYPFAFRFRGGRSE